jgi:hypothetical protein
VPPAIARPFESAICLFVDERNFRARDDRTRSVGHVPCKPPRY